MNFLKRRDNNLVKEIRHNRFTLGQLLTRHIQEKKITSLAEVEFKVFSQFGDDGILQYLVHHVEMPELFIEFGVEDYIESNTRFLLMNNNWKGLVIDGSKANIDFIREDEIYWKYSLTAVHSFVTKENINEIFTGNNFKNEIGILSIDIDGNDYWVLEAINTVNPVVIVVEYNSIFGNQHTISVPYKKDFYRTRAHHSNLYWGCSLAALLYLAEKKGYQLAGCNSAGNNAYFIRKDKANGLPAPALRDAYACSKFRESRDKDGRLTFLSDNDRIDAIRDCRVVDVISRKEYTIKDLFQDVIK